MNNASEFIEEIKANINDWVQQQRVVKSIELGLDQRAGWSLIVSDDAVICPKHSDGSLQYYGGFEYIKEHRVELGDYVFYLREDSRVESCFDYLAMHDAKEKESK